MYFLLSKADTDTKTGFTDTHILLLGFMLLFLKLWVPLRNLVREPTHPKWRFFSPGRQACYKINPKYKAFVLRDFRSRRCSDIKLQLNHMRSKLCLPFSPCSITLEKKMWRHPGPSWNQVLSPQWPHGSIVAAYFRVVDY